MPMAQRKRREKDPDARQRAGKAKSCDGEKPPLAAALPVRSIPPKMPQEHGGAIYQGGVLGHRGGNQHTVRARSEELRGALQARRRMTPEGLTTAFEATARHITEPHVIDRILNHRRRSACAGRRSRAPPRRASRVRAAGVSV